MSEYKRLLRAILDKGHRKSDRTDTGTISMFGYQARFNLQEGFPIVTEKRTAFKMAITEMIWMIGGWMKDPAYEDYQRTNIKFLLDNNCHIWTEWPYKAYCNYISNSIPLQDDTAFSIDGTKRALTQIEFEQRIISDKEFAIEFGDLGPVYQKQWRNFEGKKEAVDQLMVMIDRLRTNPDCRRNISSYWNPTELKEMLLPPCHLFHQVWTRELSLEERRGLYVGSAGWHAREDEYEVAEYDACNIPRRAISLQMYQRSSDTFLGVPFDWVWYAAFTHMLAMITNMVPEEFIWVSGDTHIYLNHIKQVTETLRCETYPYPKLIIKRSADEIKSIEDFRIEDFALENYQSGPAIKAPVAV
jgi:thymidylate synthase